MPQGGDTYAQNQLGTVEWDQTPNCVDTQLGSTVFQCSGLEFRLKWASKYRFHGFVVAN